ncbi:hypothetical protein QEH52_04980 [Coraliomargarita sp. SDUM461003]|uniref:YtkA-like domain-containing protein n=1 Tax=Thalassobacterium maritimum TaxID=3041265 RepID=A0ABU1ARS0_9BACT|nr:hypothetical protein [Coraliomargarita sp. SDUM461003]MDQ8206851.1 hypothetical protein [Coraliomargarita sp. SDUM461003]
MTEQSSKSLSKTGWVSIGMLSLVFFGAYFVLRALPAAQCGFLHYEEIVNAEGEIELCATNHAGFIDLTRFTYPIVTELSSDTALEPGVTAQVELNLQTQGGTNIAPHELAVTHTEKMHVMVIDPSLEDYHHVHPRADGLNGRYQFDFKPTHGGAYRVFTEIVPLRSRSQAIALSELAVAGESQRPKFERSTVSVVDGVRFELLGAPESLQRGRDYRFEVKVAGAEGAVVHLETIMGAKGHMVAFDAAGKGFAHMHPVDSVASARTAGFGGGTEESSELAFLFNVPNTGWYRLFAQIQVEGKPVFGRFDLQVE